MKILITTVLLGALGAGSLLFASTGSGAAARKVPQSCDATVTCTPEGTCVVTCQRPDGSTCSIEIVCDGEDCRIVGCDGPQDCPQSCQPGCR